jgi:hypothetical protein
MHLGAAPLTVLTTFALPRWRLVNVQVTVSPAPRPIAFGWLSQAAGIVAARARNARYSPNAEWMRDAHER